MTILDTVTTATDAAIAVDERYVAHNYSPLPVVAASAEGNRAANSFTPKSLKPSAASQYMRTGFSNQATP